MQSCLGASGYAAVSYPPDRREYLDFQNIYYDPVAEYGQSTVLFKRALFFKLKITAKQSRRSINKELIVSELLVANTAGIRSSKDRNKLELRKVSYKEGNAKQQISSVVRSCLNPL